MFRFFLILCLLLSSCAPRITSAPDFNEDIARAEQLYNAGDYANAQEAFTNISDAAQGTDPYAQAEAMMFLGRIERSTGEPERALHTLQQARTLYEQLDDTLGVAHVLNSIGISYDYLTKTNEARAAFNEALQLLKTIDDIKGQANTTMNLAILDLNEGVTKQAERGFLDAQTLFVQLEDVFESRLGQARVFSNLGTLEIDRAELSRAYSYLLEALALLKLLDIPKEQADAYLALGRLELQRGNLAQAQNLFETSLAIYESIDHSYLETALYYLAYVEELRAK